ncbi:MAG: Hsp33 family molecular chaperone HslO [Bdellovibrionales bacterium]|nr:Hsp33 family molecular chaperone HslO [Bdellovibrionales bacterium]
MNQPTAPQGTGFLRKALSADGTIIVAIEAKDLLQAQMDRTHAHPPSMIHLGQAMLSALLIQALTDPEENDRVQAEWLVDGPFGHVYAEAFGTGRLRGTVGNLKTPAELLGQSVGNGVFQVRKHHNSSVYTGMIETTGQISTDLVEYLEKSEQRLCGANLSVKIEWDESGTADNFPFRIKSAHGFLVHVLPEGVSGERRQKLLERWDAQIRALGPISQWKLSVESRTVTEEMVSMLSMEIPHRTIFETPVNLHCTCSEDRAARAVALLGPTTPGAPAHTVRCEFCGAVYQIGAYAHS